jgi:hypothetical protein
MTYLMDVGELLRERGHVVTLTKDLQLERAHDGLQLVTATRRQALLVSHNGKDFRLLHRAWCCWTEEWAIGAQHAGILILPHGSELDSVAHLLAFLQTGHSAENHVFRYFPPPRGWELYE